MKPLVTAETIERKISLIHGQKVMLDSDLAELYGVTTKRLNEQVRRNAYRFPGDFMFRLTKAEKDELVANCDRFSNLKYSRVLRLAAAGSRALMAVNVLDRQHA